MHNESEMKNTTINGVATKWVEKGMYCNEINDVTSMKETDVGLGFLSETGIVSLV